MGMGLREVERGCRPLYHPFRNLGSCRLQEVRVRGWDWDLEVEVDHKGDCLPLDRHPLRPRASYVGDRVIYEQGLFLTEDSLSCWGTHNAWAVSYSGCCFIHD